MVSLFCVDFKFSTQFFTRSSHSIVSRSLPTMLVASSLGVLGVAEVELELDDFNSADGGSEEQSSLDFVFWVFASLALNRGAKIVFHK